MNDTRPKTGFIRTSRTTKSATGNGESLDDIARELEDMVGLESVKQELNRLYAYARVIALRRERDIPTGGLNLHMVFTGPPGTGKTEIARKVGRVLKAIGLLRKGHCVEVGRSDLANQYQNSGSILMRDRVKEALDGVLFIDEAYTIAGRDPQHGIDQSGKEIIDTLLKEMEDYRDRLVVIVAGYTNQMRGFLDSNPGLRSRFSRTIEFPSYSADELYEIFGMMVRKGHYALEGDAAEVARRYIRELRGQVKDRDAHEFGNARAIRGYFETILPVQAERIAEMEDFESLPDEELLAISAQDAELAAEHHRNQM